MVSSLAAAEEARVRQHLEECEACAQRDAELVAGHEGLMGQVPVLPPADLPAFRGSRWTGILVILEDAGGRPCRDRFRLKTSSGSSTK